MRKWTVLGLLILTLVAALPSTSRLFAASSADASNIFGPAVLSGPYLIQVAGASLDNSGHLGNLAISGVITFNGAGAVSAIDITISAFDRSVDAEHCSISGALSASLSFYAVNPDGTGTLGIGIPLNSCLNSSLTSNGSIQFNMALAHSRGGQSQLVSNGAISNLTDQSGDVFTNLLLTGILVHQ